MSPAGAGDQERDLDPGFEPDEVRYIRDTDTLKALSDPTRVRLLETMIQRRSPAWSVKELAAALGVPPTRLYHHVELLLERDLVRPVERRVVSGIIETRYLPAARSFQIDRSLFAGGNDEGMAVLADTLAAMFDTARAEIEQAIRAGAAVEGDDVPPERRLLLSRGVVRLTPERAAELRHRLQALADEFGDEPGPDGWPADARSQGVFIAVYPLPDPQEPSDA